ncbi:hypothetical protein FJZ53_00905 [Candidatus Woesearchaeota archaeon]|nr:hypothetical protein [Candidatus Woesearchaeota archaeon]
MQSPTDAAKSYSGADILRKGLDLSQSKDPNVSTAESKTGVFYDGIYIKRRKDLEKLDDNGKYRSFTIEFRLKTKKKSEDVFNEYIPLSTRKIEAEISKEGFEVLKEQKGTRISFTFIKKGFFSKTNIGTLIYSCNDTVHGVKFSKSLTFLEGRHINGYYIRETYQDLKDELDLIVSARKRKEKPQEKDIKKPVIPSVIKRV